MLKYEKTKDFVILFYYITFVTIVQFYNGGNTRELIEMMRQGPVSIDMSDYSGFEKGVIPESEKSRICPVGKKRLEAAALQQYLLLRNREDSASLQKRYWWSPNHYQHRAMYGCIWLCVFRFLSALQHLTLSIDL